MSEVSRIRNGTHYTVGQVGPLEALDNKLFVGQSLGFTGMEVSLNRFVPGQEVPFLHRHRLHEEMYLFIRGHGQFQIDGDYIDIEPGTIVRIAPEAIRGWRNNSTEDLYCIVIQANLESLTGQDGIRLGSPAQWPD